MGKLDLAAFAEVLLPPACAPWGSKIAGWANQQAFDAGELTWVKREGMAPLGADWRRLA